MRSAAMIALLLGSQDSADVLLERLGDDRIDVRSDAAARLVELYPEHEAAIRRRAEAAADPDLRARLADIVRRGERRVDRRAFARNLSPRVRAAWPDVEEELFGDDLARRAAAIRTLGQAGTDAGVGPRRGFFMAHRDARATVPFLTRLLDDGADPEPLKSAWIHLVAARPALLEHPRVEAATRPLFRDVSPRVRALAFELLHATPMFDLEAEQLLANPDAVSPAVRPRLEDGIVRRKIEKGYPLVVRRLGDIGRREALIGAIFEHEVRQLVMEVVRAVPHLSSYLLERVPRPDIEAALLGLLEGPPEGRRWGMAGLTQHRFPGHEARAVAELASRDGDLRIAALGYLRDLAPADAGHAKAVARRLRELWEREAEERPSSEVAAACDILRLWTAREEVEALLPSIRDADALMYAGPMIRETRPPGAVRALATLAGDEDPKLRKFALRLLGELEAWEALRGRSTAVIRTLKEAGDAEWLYEILPLATAAASCGLREILPVVLGWQDHPARKGHVPALLARLWTDEEKRRALVGDDPKRRALGAWSIAYAGPSELDAVLWALHEHPDAQVRAAVAFALGRRRFPDGESTALRMARDPDPDVAAYAAWSVLVLKDPEGARSTQGARLKVDDAVDLLNHPQAQIRCAALRSLPPEWVRTSPQTLEPLLADRDPQAQSLAWRLYLEHAPLGDPEALIDRLLAGRSDAAEICRDLAQLGQRVSPERLAPSVHRLLREVVAGRKAVAESTVYRMHGEARFDKGAVAEAACRLLGLARYRDAEPDLLRLMDSPDPSLQAAGLAGIGGAGGERAVPRLLQLLGAERSYEVQRALAEIGRLPADVCDPRHGQLEGRLRVAAAALHRDSFENAAALIHHSEWAVCLAAVDAVSFLARREDARRILDLAYTPIDSCRARLLRALRRFPAGELRAEVAGFLDDVPAVSFEAARVLAACGIEIDPETLPVSLDALPVETLVPLLPVLPREAVKLRIPRLLEAARPPWFQNRWPEAVRAARALARLGEPDVLPELMGLLRDYPEHSVSPVLEDVAKGFREGAVGALRDLLRTGGPEGRASAARLLAELDDRPSADLIEVELLRSKGPGAIRALLRLGRTESARAVLAAEKETRALAEAAVGGLPEARREAVGRLRAEPREVVGLIMALNRARDPELWDTRLGWSPAEGFARLEAGVRFIDREGGVRLRMSPTVRRSDLWPPADGVSDETTLGWLFLSTPFGRFPRHSVYAAEDGVICVDDLESVRAVWTRRLSE